MREWDRLEQRLASVFTRVELRYAATHRVFGSCDVPFWEEDTTSALFNGGVDLRFQGGEVLADFEYSFEVAFEVVDPGGKAFQRTWIVPEDGGIGDDAYSQLRFPSLGYIQSPNDYFNAEKHVVDCLFEVDATFDEPGRLSELYVLAAWRGNQRLNELEMCQVLEMILHEQTTVT